MVTNPLDARGLLAVANEANTPWPGQDAHTTIGHVHLRVAHIPAAEKFYVDILGLDLMQHYGNQASFVSAGGYHHHLGFNTWAGVGAPPPTADAARLAWYELVLPGPDALRAVVNRLQRSGLSPVEEAGRWHIDDPAQNHLVLTL
ncbi:MAG: VOC family protein [Caldilineaceae bacterium]|nr:VOC family protein [Caldilineaceae bacterium]